MNRELPDVAEIVGGGFIVASKIVEGAWRYVDPDGACSCPARVRVCRHRRAVDVYLLEKNAKHARPVAKPNISALVD